MRAAVGGLVDPGAVGDVRADRRLARARVDDVRVGGCEGERADRRDRLDVEQRLPGDSGIPGGPHAAVHGAEVERRGITGDTTNPAPAAAAVRADDAPREW